MKINKHMIAFFIYGLNTLIDNGENINKTDMLKLIESKDIISYINRTFKLKYWDFTALIKYEDDLSDRLMEYYPYLSNDSYSKFGVENNGYIILNSIATGLLLDFND
ncbi:hypothetical protein G9G63_09880 [Paenibacillus sp. EKM202P]|uniref:hypothetical protein n=1 Tax=unclassified Paenibacillus TaxID=185978 RepID=UPI0013EBD974|nr:MULTISPECIES: hypothetical protein [unclassified Paenibacillus]KAF6565456.1 hypothetical protein G9G63_09880 [Paenibacillus sp. EKM202P]KAF6569219.1 hypothetical protein G9G64_12215 [Paenibacillus sp. EKM207P]